MSFKKLLKKYTPAEIAESFVFKVKLTKKQMIESNALMNKMRKESAANRTPDQILLMNLLQLKYRV